MSLYHLRIVYDTSSFTCISVCASFTSASGSKGSIKNTHVIPPLVLFAIAYICFCVTLAIKLDGWDEELPGRCYNTQFTAAPSTTQPLGSYISLIITSLYSLAALLICYTVSTAANVTSSKSRFLRSLMSLLLVKVRRALRSSSSSVAENILAAHIHEVRDPIPGLIYSSRKPEDYAWLIISLAMYQYPIHLYMTIALGAANESLLSGDSENAWGFGQIVALILCATTLLECVKGIFDYRKRTHSERIIEEAEHVQAAGNIGRRNSY
ncbi:hypothetical protein DER45DRAFT_317013 [Fusarium avenaceum]|nr:hypothetical protein DER45DRAFT_317013 [Fusarium avenaceum]